MRQKIKHAHSFSMTLDTLASLKEVSYEAKIAGGMSAIVEDATRSWLRRYKADPKAWLIARGIAASAEPSEDDI